MKKSNKKENVLTQIYIYKNILDNIKNNNEPIIIIFNKLAESNNFVNKLLNKNDLAIKSIHKLHSEINNNYYLNTYIKQNLKKLLYDGENLFNTINNESKELNTMLLFNNSDLANNINARVNANPDLCFVAPENILTERIRLQLQLILTQYSNIYNIIDFVTKNIK